MSFRNCALKRHHTREDTPPLYMISCSYYASLRQAELAVRKVIYFCNAFVIFIEHAVATERFVTDFDRNSISIHFNL